VGPWTDEDSRYARIPKITSICHCSEWDDSSLLQSKLFKERSVLEWVNWGRKHDYLGMNIVSHKTSIQDVKVVGGNPFEDGCRLTTCGAPPVAARFIKPAVFCVECGKPSIGVHHCRPNHARWGHFSFVLPGFRGDCYVCGDQLSGAVDECAFRARFKSHLERNER